MYLCTLANIVEVCRALTDSHTSFIRAGSKIRTNVNLICTAGRAPLGKLKIIYKKIIMAPLTARHPKSLRFLNQRRKQNCSVSHHDGSKLTFCCFSLELENAQTYSYSLVQTHIGSGSKCQGKWENK